MSMYGCNFSYKLVLVLSQVPLKRARAELHIDTKNKTIGAEIADKRDDPDLRRLWLMASLNWGQICNTQNTRATIR